MPMTTLDDVIQQGWGAHADKTAEVADSLESSIDLVADAKGAVGFMHLVNHAVGDHLGDRERALRICEAAAARIDEPGPDPMVHLAVARHLAGEVDKAREAENAAGGDEATKLRIDLLVAQGHAHAGDWNTAEGLYNEALQAAKTLAEGHGAERAAAVVSNNIASELLELAERSTEQDAFMAKAADAARVFWLRVGNWMNDMRADYLLSLVHTKLGKPAEGRLHAQRGLATIAENGEAKVDAAFLHLADAAGARDLGETDEHQEAIGKATALAAEFDDDGLTTWFEGELAKAR